MAKSPAAARGGASASHPTTTKNCEVLLNGKERGGSCSGGKPIFETMGELLGCNRGGPRRGSGGKRRRGRKDGEAKDKKTGLDMKGISSKLSLISLDQKGKKEEIESMCESLKSSLRATK